MRERWEIRQWGEKKQEKNKREETERVYRRKEINKRNKQFS
jgi:hypothetical protein